jgi:hypothetical protein
VYVTNDCLTKDVLNMACKYCINVGKLHLLMVLDLMIMSMEKEFLLILGVNCR